MNKNEFQKYPYSPWRRDWNQNGLSVCETTLEFPQGGEVTEQILSQRASNFFLNFSSHLDSATISKAMLEGWLTDNFISENMFL